MILNIGSLNIDQVFNVAHIVKSGETLSSSSYLQFPGGKGANQAIAISRTGCQVQFMGKVGHDGTWILDILKNSNVLLDYNNIDLKEPSGRAIVQVSAETSDNSIILYAGTNHQLDPNDVKNATSDFNSDDVLLLQNEINVDAIVTAMNAAYDIGMAIAYNPAPCSLEITSKVPISKIHTLIVNEIEALAICSLYKISPSIDATNLAKEILNQEDNMSLVIITLGNKGVVIGVKQIGDIYTVKLPCFSVKAIDTTGAGDTFVGYIVGILNMKLRKLPLHWSLKDIQEILIPSLEIAVAASGISCEQLGAMNSIPHLQEVLRRMNG